MDKGSFSFKQFYVHRIKRIFPALILVLSFALIFGCFCLLPSEYMQLGKHVAASAGFIQNFILWHEAGYFDNLSELKPLMHLWSLGIEEQYYFVYPLLVVSLWRRKHAVLWFLLGGWVLSFLLNVGFINSYPILTFFLPHTRFWELFSGGILAYLTIFKAAEIRSMISSFTTLRAFNRFGSELSKEKAFYSGASLVGFILILSALLFTKQSSAFPGWWALIPVLGSVILIFSGSESLVNKSIFSQPILVWAGLISYPLYLWHWPLLSFARIMESGTPVLWIRAIIFLISFILAWVTYRIVEVPLRFGTDRSSRKTLVLVLFAALIGIAGYIVFVREGHIGKVVPPPQISDATSWNCRLAYPKFKGAFCEMSRPEQPTFLMIGDSHSGALFPALNHQLAKENILLMGGLGCLTFFDVTVAHNGAKGDDGCKEVTDYLLDYTVNTAAKLASLKTIIVTMRGPMYISGLGYGEFAQAHQVEIGLASEPAEHDFSKIFELSMSKTIEKLVATRKQIIFVLDVPELGFAPVACMNVRPLRLTDREKKPCAVPREDFDSRNKEYRRIALAVLKKYPMVQIFDAAKNLCDDKFCWAKRDGKMLYIDDTHLSPEGADLIAAKLVEEMKLAN